MTTPIWILLLFAMWTLITLFGSVGVYRWSRILTGKVAIGSWRADEAQGDDWYRRAMRAHANCVENLPVYSAIVVAAVATGTESSTLDYAALTLLACRVCQTVTHIAFKSTNMAASMRFAFFAAQAVCMIVMGANIAMTEFQ